MMTLRLVTSYFIKDINSLNSLVQSHSFAQIQLLQHISVSTERSATAPAAVHAVRSKPAKISSTV